MITDLGYYDDYIVNNLTGSQAMLVEANHDVNLFAGRKLSVLFKAKAYLEIRDICPTKCRESSLTIC